MVENDYIKIPSKDVDIPVEKNQDPPKYGYGVRHVQCILIFMSYSIGYLARAHMGVTIVAMTNRADSLNTQINDTGPLNNTRDINESSGFVAIENHESSIYRTYDWPKSTQEMVLTSFFVGYSIMTFLSAMICQRYGGKLPLQISLFVNGAVSIVSPWVVAWGGWKALCVCRILQGASQGGLLPGMHTLLANWIPLSERASLGSYVYTGSGFGTVVGFQLSGVLAYSRLQWPSTFWIVGVICLIGFAVLTIFGAATPADHKRISEAEKNFIMGNNSEGTHTKPNIPWKLILSSKAVLSTFLTHIGSATCYVFLFIQVPTYMYAILKVNIKESGVLASLPYISFIVCCCIFGYLSDFLTNRKIIQVKNVRKIANSIGSVIPALCLTLVCFTTNVSLAVVCFVTALGAHSGSHAGWVVSYIDLSPNYSGVLMGIGNGLANGCVLLLPVLVSNIVTDVTNQTQWRLTMFIMATSTVLSNIVYVIFVSADVKPWNDYENTKELGDVALETKKNGLKTKA
ncbi:unnamed protein product [Leptidea sinapis]|uniref:Major facilitator superfamily (MFS) profile domain-containing protein n=1 Tax=Leptidea sinapis TaxID=189913 RepID=A0A5E4R266_9NEOP|nr:unnamed protein product [Leptidea sinapis]